MQIRFTLLSLVAVYDHSFVPESKTERDVDKTARRYFQAIYGKGGRNFFKSLSYQT